MALLAPSKALVKPLRNPRKPGGGVRERTRRQRQLAAGIIRLN